MELNIVATGEKKARYIDAAETAKYVRIALKKHFPGIKFSVRSKTYSGGASIDIDWTDGPLCSQVDAVVQPFSGANFDGMIDMKNYHSSWLLSDGSAIVADDHGTVDSKGFIPPEHNAKPEFQAERVRFGADFIFTHRNIGPELAKEAAREVAFKYGFELCPVREGWKSWGLDDSDQRSKQFSGSEWSRHWEYQEIFRRYLNGEESVSA